MVYIIDANNLAGKLKMLGENDFDIRLIRRMKEYSREYNKEIELVFDGSDNMGDKRRLAGNKLSVIYAPAAGRRHSADDKIVEMVERYLSRGRHDFTVVTDDIGLKNRVEEAAARYGRTIIIERATWWSEKLTIQKGEEPEKTELSRSEVEKINSELKKYWQ